MLAVVSAWAAREMEGGKDGRVEAGLDVAQRHAGMRDTYAVAQS